VAGAGSAAVHMLMSQVLLPYESLPAWRNGGAVRGRRRAPRDKRVRIWLRAAQYAVRGSAPQREVVDAAYEGEARGARCSFRRNAAPARHYMRLIQSGVSPRAFSRRMATNGRAMTARKTSQYATVHARQERR